MTHPDSTRRFVAYFIDSLILTVAFFIIGLIIGFLFGAVETFLTLLNIVVVWLYFALMESSENQATIGKAAVSIKVTDMYGDRIGFGKATGRYFGKILSTLILFIGFIMIGFNDKRQALHDQMAGTLVVMK